MMHAYFKSVLALVFFVALLNGIFGKEGAGKYTRFAAGLMVITVILSPLFSLGEVFQDVRSDIKPEKLEEISAECITETFEEVLSDRTAEEIKRQTGERVNVTVQAALNNDGDVVGVKKAYISPYSTRCAALTAEILGIDISGVERNE